MYGLPTHPFNKNLDCRPDGIGEILRSVRVKTMMEVAKEDVRGTIGNLQVYAGQQAGSYVAIHYIRKTGLYEDRECKAVLMVDASNAFNTISRKAACTS